MAVHARGRPPYPPVSRRAKPDGKERHFIGLVPTGRWFVGPSYPANAKIVVLLKVWPAASVVDGKDGSFGESGKCWVSNV